MAAEVSVIQSVASGVKTLVLRPVHRRTFPPFRGGDHVQFQIEDGQRREYSLCGAAGDLSSYQVAVAEQADGRGVSRRINQELTVGSKVFISYPQPGMAIDPTAPRHVFVAGGIGVTAILGLLQELTPGSDVEIHYCVRSTADAAFVDRLQRSGHPLHIHDSSAGARLDVQAFAESLTPGTHVYQCGPTSLMTSIETAVANRDGVVIHQESFGAPPRTGEVLGPAFEADLLLSGRTIEVDQRTTLLEAILGAGVQVEYSCEGGICGTCVLEVIDGDVEHRDLCLKESERSDGLMATCVSRGSSRLSIRA